MVHCESCQGNECDGACEEKVKELKGIIGEMDNASLKTLLLGAGGDVNR